MLFIWYKGTKAPFFQEIEPELKSDFFPKLTFLNVDCVTDDIVSASDEFFHWIIEATLFSNPY